MLNISKRTVQRLAAQGQLPVVTKLPGTTGAYLFDMEGIRDHQNRG